MKECPVKEIYFETYGCSANQNSTEIMKGLVKQAGLEITSNIGIADLVVLNSCIVKEPTEEKIMHRVNCMLKDGKKIILAGCMPRINKKNLQKNDDLFLLDISRIKDIANLIRDIAEKKYSPEKYLSVTKEIKSNLPKISKERFIGINQISEGCLEDCSYCIVKIAKGRLFSYPMEKIIESVKRDINSGCREIWITSQDNANYGNDAGKALLPELLKNILKIKWKFFVRVGMMNPNNISKILPELLDTYKNEKMFKFLHIPIQSGSNDILKKMKRPYKIEDAFRIINEFKKNIPEVTIATDIIVGFPEETEEDFEKTIKAIEKINPEILNISKFWPRKNTEASKMMQIPHKIANERATKLSKMHFEMCKKNQEKFIGMEEYVIVDQANSDFPGTYIARNKNYKLFAVISHEKIIGKIVKVKVNKITPHYLIANVLNENKKLRK